MIVIQLNLVQSESRHKLSAILAYPSHWFRHSGSCWQCSALHTLVVQTNNDRDYIVKRVRNTHCGIWGLQCVWQLCLHRHVDVSWGFNKYFSSVGETLVQNLTNDPMFNNLSFTSYLDKELFKLIENLNTHKSPGPDGIAPKLIKEIAPLILQPLLYLFNLSVYHWAQVPSLTHLNWPKLFLYIRRVNDIYPATIDQYRY